MHEPGSRGRTRFFGYAIVKAVGAKVLEMGNAFS